MNQQGSQRQNRDQQNRDQQNRQMRGQQSQQQLQQATAALQTDQVKAQAIAQTNQTAYSLLFPSDWMVIKFVETQVPVAADWTTYRANVRTVAADTKTAITAATTVDEVAAIMSSIVWPVSPDAPVQNGE